MEVKLIAYMQPNISYLAEHNPWHVKAAITETPEWIAAAAMRSTRTTQPFHEIMNECNEETIEKRIKGSIKMGHFTVAGMTDFIFLIEDVSRSLTHQLVRHRTAWFLQQSSRATNPSNGEPILPLSIVGDTYTAGIFFEIMDATRTVYRELIEMGIPREDARFVLTQATPQRIVMKIDGSNLLHFFKLRLAPEAQWEIQELAERMHEEVMKVCPNLFDRELEEYWW